MTNQLIDRDEVIKIVKWILSDFRQRTVHNSISDIENLPIQVESQIMPSWDIQRAYHNWYKEWHNKALEALEEALSRITNK